MRPMWAITGMSTRVMASIVSAIVTPPSSLTAAAPPSFTSRTLLSIAWGTLTWYEPKGRSPTSSARVAPRLASRVWYTASSRVTGSVFGTPWTTMPIESPTRTTSTPASSASAANVASYAVTMTILSSTAPPWALRPARPGTVIFSTFIGRAS